jgi:FkbM family methyltransferase
MRLKELLYLLGFKPKSRTYGFEINSFDLPDDGRVEYAQWLHPGESRKELTQEAVNELRKYLSAGDVAIDIGAHSGDTTVPMALAVGPSGCVLALEPNSYVFPVLKMNSELNTSKTSIIPLMIAATQSDEELEFEYSDSGFCNGGFHEGISRLRHGHAFSLKVQGRNLVALLEAEYPNLIDRIRYIKIDTEGYDLSVIKSIHDLLARQMPFLKAEVYKHTDRQYRREMHRILSDLGYALHKVEGDGKYTGQELSAQDMSDWRHFDVFCIPHKR